MAEPAVGLWALYVGVAVVSVATQAFVAYWVYTRQGDRDGATWFLAMVGTGLVFALPTVVFLLPFGALRRPAYMLSAFAALPNVWAFVAFVSTYTGDGFHKNRLLQAFYGAIIVGFLALAPFNASHGLLFAEFTPLAEPFPHLAVERGPVFAAMITLIELPALYAVYVMVRHLLATRRKAGLQLPMFIAGAFSVITLDALSQFTGLFPVQFSHAAFGQLPFYVLTAVSLFRFGLLDVKPVARNTVIENLRDPVLVLDDRQRVVDYNEAATHVWPDIADEIPAPFTTACPALAGAVTVPPTGDGGIDQLSLPYDDEDRHYSVTVSSVSEGGEDETGWFSILLRDITKLERSRWQLEKQNDRLDQVASTISHDLRNPITVVDGNIELADVRLEQADVDRESRQRVQEKLQNADGATDRMQDIIDDILTIAREGKTVEETEIVSLDAVAHDAWATVDTKQATLTTDDYTLQADRSKLRTILENLLRNTLDHGPNDVTVEVGPTEDGFYVADDGPGIPPEHADSVFEYGYTTTDEGTGLGLSIVRTMAESHGWTVEHDLDYDGGTRFMFRNVGTHPSPTTDDESMLVTSGTHD